MTYISKSGGFKLTHEEWVNLRYDEFPGPYGLHLVCRWGKHIIKTGSFHEYKINQILKKTTKLPTLLYPEDFMIMERSYIIIMKDIYKHGGVKFKSLPQKEKDIVIDMVLNTLLELHEKMEFIHNDIHNFFVVKLDNPETFTLFGKTFITSYIPLLYDFEYSSLVYKSKHYLLKGQERDILVDISALEKISK